MNHFPKKSESLSGVWGMPKPLAPKRITFRKKLNHLFLSDSFKINQLVAINAQK